VEALPCNEIYIPLQNLHHRVWRIVADESIVLSTKERVPCIVCLEVVNYTPEQRVGGRDIGNLLKLRSSHKPATVSEREMVETWRNSRRDPYRRETAFNRVTQGMGKIPDKMKVSMQEMQEQIRHKLSHMREQDQHDFWSNVSEGFESTGSLSINSNGTRNNTGTSGERSAMIKDAESGDTIDTGALSSQPSSPKSPRTTIQKGAMGQWTKSPAPKGSLACTSPGGAIDVSTASNTIPDLAAPEMNSPKYGSYQTVNNTGSNSNLSRRRFSNSSYMSARVEKQAKDDDDENDSNRSENNSDESTRGRSNKCANGAKLPTKPPPVVFKENWKEKEDRLRSASAFGNHPGWRLLPVLVKSNDDLRQEQLASQLIQRMALILARDNIPVWLCPYEILALDASGGLIEAIPDTISLASLKKNDPDYTDLNGFFAQYFYEHDALVDAKANFCESLAAYSMVCFLLQVKDRHNGNILLDNRGHLIHIDFGFFFLSSPGKNTGFESAPFKLTREFVNVLGGPDSHLFSVFRTLCYRTFISLRKHCHEIIMLVEMLQLGNEDLACFLGRPEDAIRELRQRFRLDLNDRACLEYVNALIDESLENWRTNWYDRYQRYCVGVL